MKGIYEKTAYRRFSQAIGGSLETFPFDELTKDNYVYVTKEFVTNKPILDAFIDIYYEIGIRHAAKVGKAIRDEIQAETKALADDDPEYVKNYKRFVSEWVLKNAGTKIRSVRESLIKEIIKIISEGFEDRLTLQELTSELKKRIKAPGFYRWQALRIARTETTAAANLGALKAGDDSGVLYEKEWISSIDKRTRRKPRDEYDHVEMDGVTVDDGKDFDVQGDALRFPGAPEGDASNVINCRCTVVLLIKRDAAGRIVYRDAA